MVKRVLMLALTLCLVCCAAAAEAFDSLALERTPDCLVYQEAPGINTVVRPVEQPFDCTVDRPGDELVCCLDFIEMPNENAVFLRLTLSLMTRSPLNASEMTVVVDGKRYVFSVTAAASEYDQLFFEDYAVCITDESMPLVKAVARSRRDGFEATLHGDVDVACVISLPPESVKGIYDLYAGLGGLEQDLSPFRERWPVTITKK